MEAQAVSPVATHPDRNAGAGADWLQRVAIVIPTYKAEQHWSRLQPSLAMQGISPDRVLVLDSSSPDRTVDLARAARYRVVLIPQHEFNHGGTRQLALTYLPDAEFLLYITQDVEFATPDGVLQLCQTMDDSGVGTAYGRQLPRDLAGPIERHARLFNYPEVSHVRTFADRQTFGIRTAFLSNSFAVYRRSALEAVGGFPTAAIFGEDSYVALKMLIAGWKIAYAAEAAVIHSHPLTVAQEFKRYFDIGAQHAREPWMLEACGKAGSEGIKFVRSELRYLLRHSKGRIPVALLRTASKLVAYRVGLLSPRLPRSLNRRLALHPSVWK